MELKKKLPIGIEFFKDFKREGFYYVDKTGFIRDLINSRGSVNLITRPRRLGKSLNMDMLSSSGRGKLERQVKRGIWYRLYGYLAGDSGNWSRLCHRGKICGKREI